MAKFIFRMQSILNIKSRLEEQAKQEFALARRALDEAQERLRALYGRKDDYLEEGRKLQDDRLHVQDIIDNRTYIMTIEGYIDLQQIAVERAEKLLEEARLKMTEATKERKTYERLREKAFAEYVREEDIREMKEVDELTSYKYAVRENV
ncbi:MAG: flagellar export protein FliJ [Lachnospiraceae bacterium]|jgi:flagellar FliJ protein|nr:flagellar export protein FliJ [Lachnospiraceae bacterium]